MSPDEILRRQRAARLAADKALLRDLTDEYAKTFQAVRTELARLTKQIAEARARGEVVSPAWLFQSQRLDRFERELGAELTLYLDLAKRKIEAASIRAVMDGREDAHSLLVSTLPAGVAPVPAIPLRQLQGMVEGTRPGTALAGLLAGLGEKAALEAREKLIEGVTLGLGTREIGRNLRDAFGGNAVRSLLVARTEVIRSYRQAALQTYKQNRGVVAGWVWIASLGPRTCPVCIAKHGSFHPLEEDFASHPACRCSPAPSTKSWADLGVPGVPETKVDPESGEDWFRRQDPITQKAILGPGKYRLYEDGDIQISDLVAETNSKVWGKGLRERPLRDLVGTSSPTTPSPISGEAENVLYNILGPSHYKRVNGYLRGTLGSDVDALGNLQERITSAEALMLDRDIDVLDQVFAGLPPSVDERTLYRGVQFADEGVTVIEGGELTDPGFSWTSHVRETAESFADESGDVLEILAPRGTRYLDFRSLPRLGDEDWRAHEDPVLFPRGSRFEVLSITRRAEGGGRYIRLRLRP